MFEFGIIDATAMMYYSIGIFIYTIIFGICLLISGKFANYKKRRHEFYKEKLTIIKAEDDDKKNRADQQAEYQAKIDEAAALAKKNALAAGKTNIQDAAPTKAPAAAAPSGAAVSPEDVRLISTK